MEIRNLSNPRTIGPKPASPSLAAAQPDRPRARCCLCCRGLDCSHRLRRCCRILGCGRDWGRNIRAPFSAFLTPFLRKGGVMKNPISFCCNRSSISPRPAIMALMAAIGTLVFCLSLGLLLIINLGVAGGCLRPRPAGQVMMLLEMAGGIAAVAIPLGLVNWQLLGWIGREGSTAHTAAGLVEGVACAAIACRRGRRRHRDKTPARISRARPNRSWHRLGLRALRKRPREGEPR